jgi:16S rRNA processing protein RimM
VFYHFEILGARVSTDEGRYLGIVTEILTTGAHDVYVVQGEQREYLIPATDDVVRQIDREHQTIIIHPLTGLLDL